MRHISIFILSAIANLIFQGCSGCRSNDNTRLPNESGISTEHTSSAAHTSDISDEQTMRRSENQEEQLYAKSDESFSAANALVMVRTLEDLSEQILVRKAFVASYNKDSRCPNWVGWHLTGDHADGPVDRRNDFHEEEEVPTPRAMSSDYKSSGWSRGHMCPAGDNKWSAEAMFETFSFANICPQNTNLNNGLWNSIENDCRKWARKYGDVFIVCGPVYYNQEHQAIGENKVVVPEAFFKVVLRLAPKPKAFGFIVKNTDGNRKSDLYYNSIDQVERITGHDFFYELPDDIEDAVESEEPNIDEW